MGKVISKKRIPSLDGLRAISILMVVFGHAFKGYFKYVNVANLGVRFFFIISAYLIVGILLNDIRKNRFSVKTFYFKRILRTFPAFYFYLIVVCFLLLFLDLFEWEQFWRAPIYLENYHPRSLWNSNQWFIGHTWSLAVEEQFYIVIAFFFWLVHKNYISMKQLLNIFILIVIVIPIIRISYMFFTGIPNVLRGSIHRSFETVADSLAIGGIIAVLPIQKILKSNIITFFYNKVWILIVIIVLISLLNSSYFVAEFGLKSRYLYNLIGLTIIHICLGWIMILAMNFSKETLFFKALNKKAIVTIGLWSYSIYLWQQVWLYSWDFPLIYKFLGIIICVLFSYYLIEVKFLNWRDKILNKNILDK